MYVLTEQFHNTYETYLLTYLEISYREIVGTLNQSPQAVNLFSIASHNFDSLLSSKLSHKRRNYRALLAPVR